MIHILLLLAILATIPLAPALTVPALAAWGIVAALGRATDSAPAVAAVQAESGGGCATVLWMIVIVAVGFFALAVLVVGGAGLEGRL